MKLPSKGRMVWYSLTAVFAVLAVSTAGLAVLGFFSSPPDSLAVREGRLADCPPSPNCVCTQAGDAAHRMESIPFDGSPGDAMKRLEAVLASQPRTTIVTRTENYLHAEARSRLFRFVDDVEFYVDSRDGVIQFRSASRVGHSDFGVNRARMQEIRRAFEGSP